MIRDVLICKEGSMTVNCFTTKYTGQLRAVFDPFKSLGTRFTPSHNSGNDFATMIIYQIAHSVNLKKKILNFVLKHILVQL